MVVEPEVGETIIETLYKMEFQRCVNVIHKKYIG